MRVKQKKVSGIEMVITSDRVNELEESVTLAITAKAKALKAMGADIIAFGAGEPDFDTPENIKQAAIDAIDKGLTKYTAVGGIVELKDAIIDKFRTDNNAFYSREEILVSCGGKHSFFNLCQALLNPGDEVIIPAPYWVSYPPIVALAGGVPRVVQTREEEGFRLTPEAVKSAVTDRTKAIVINSPSNPTGCAYTNKELTAVVKIALEAGLLVISDEIYEKLNYGDEPLISVASISDENTVVLNGVSKAYSMTGWRIGYAAGPAELVKAMTKIQSQSTSNPTSISQWAALEAISGPQDSVATMLEEFKKRRTLMVDGLNAIDGIKALMPEGAFYTFPNVSSYFGKSSPKGVIKGSVDFTSYLLEDAEVAVVPGAAFGADNHIRLSYACGEDDIRGGLKRIKKALSLLK